MIKLKDFFREKVTQTRLIEIAQTIIPSCSKKNPQLNGKQLDK